MNRRHRMFLMAGILLCWIAGVCSCRTSAEEADIRPFPAVQVPRMVSGRDDAADYLAEHFWDRFLDTSEVYRCDSLYVNGVSDEDLEQAFADYTGILRVTGAEKAGFSVQRLYDAAQSFDRHDSLSNVLDAVAGLARKYFYDPNSPFRNEDLYLIFADGLSRYEGTAPSLRQIYCHDAAMCSLNRPGTTANDFSFSDRYGNVRSLHGIKADYTLLFFSNPGCESCRAIVREMRTDPVLSGQVRSGKVAVVNIYIDEDVRSWYGYPDEYPEDWYNGYDHNHVIRDDVLYDVRATPSLYVLDRDKTVILKDAPEKTVFAFLRNQEAGNP